MPWRTRAPARDERRPPADACHVVGTSGTVPVASTLRRSVTGGGGASFPTGASRDEALEQNCPGGARVQRCTGHRGGTVVDVPGARRQCADWGRHHHSVHGAGSRRAGAVRRFPRAGGLRGQRRRPSHDRHRVRRARGARARGTRDTGTALRARCRAAGHDCLGRCRTTRAAHLTNHVHVVVPNGDHGVGGPCIDRMIERLVTTGRVGGVDTSCVNAAPATNFRVPSGLWEV